MFLSASKQRGILALAAGRIRCYGVPRQLALVQMTGIRLKNATADDYRRIAILQSGSRRDAYRCMLPDSYLDGPIWEERENHWRTRMSSPGSDRRLVLLAEAGGVPLGFVCILPDQETTWGALMDNLHVKPAHRAKGLGRLLFSAAANWVSKSEPRSAMHLLVFEANHRARRFYQALGGAVVEKIDQKAPGGWKSPPCVSSGSNRKCWQIFSH